MSKKCPICGLYPYSSIQIEGITPWCELRHIGSPQEENERQKRYYLRGCIKLVMRPYPEDTKTPA